MKISTGTGYTLYRFDSVLWLECTFAALFTCDSSFIAVLSLVAHGTSRSTVRRRPTSWTVETLSRRWILTKRTNATRLETGASTLRVTYNFRTQGNVNGSTTTVRYNFASSDKFATRLLWQILEPTCRTVIAGGGACSRSILARCTGDTVHRASVVGICTLFTGCFWTVCNRGEVLRGGSLGRVWASGK